MRPRASWLRGYPLSDLRHREILGLRVVPGASAACARSAPRARPFLRGRGFPRLNRTVAFVQLSALSVPALRLVANSLIRQGQLDRNPVVEMKALLKRVRNATETEVEVREAWSRDEAEILLDLAWEHEQAFAPLLEILFGTGMRRGEALGLKWQDVDFDARKLLIRRSINSQGQSTPKTGRARRVVLSERLVEMLFDLLGERQRQRISEGWPETPEWIFCNQTGTELLNPGTSHGSGSECVVAQSPRACGSSLCTRLATPGRPGRSRRARILKWVADQLGHADPSTTLKHYAHAMPEDDFGCVVPRISTSPDVTMRHQGIR